MRKWYVGLSSEGDWWAVPPLRLHHLQIGRFPTWPEALAYAATPALWKALEA
jgi:hypothetical protein